MRKGAIGLVAALVLTIFAAPAAAQEEPAATGTVTIVHGFRGLVADVYLDGTKILESFEPERSTDPVQLAAGDHQVEVREAGAGGSSSAAVEGTLSVPAGGNIAAVVHLSPEGDATMTVFPNDVATVGPGNTRLAVRHAASAPTVDVTVDGAGFAPGLANPDELAREVPAGNHRVEVRAPGATEALVPATDVPLQEGTAQYLYLIGSEEEGTLGWITQTVSGLRTIPAAVNTGDSGLLPDPSQAVDAIGTTDPTDAGHTGVSAGLLGVVVALVVAGLGTRLLYARR